MKPLYQTYLTLAIIIAICLFVVGIVRGIMWMDSRIPRDRESHSNNRHTHTVRLYDGGKEVNHWESNGTVTRTSGNNYSFIDNSTSRRVLISGTVAVE